MRQRAAARAWLLITAIGLGLLLASLIYATSSAQRKLVGEIERDPAALERDQRLAAWAIEGQMAKLDAELTRLAKLADVKEAIVSRDRAGLLEQLRPPLNRLGKSPIGVSRISFYTPDGEAYLRAHAPDASGDNVLGRRRLIAEALRKREILRGLEAEGGTPYLWVVTPLYQNGRLLGVLEMGSSLGPVVECLKAVTGGEIAVLRGTRPLEVIESSDRALFAQAAVLLDGRGADAARSRQVITVRRTARAASLVSLEDFSGGDAGTLVVLSDASAITATARRSNLVILAISVVACALAGALLVLLARRLDAFYRNLETRVEERTRELSVLVTVAQTMDSSPDVAEILRQVARQVARLLGADTVGAYLADPDGLSLCPVAEHGCPRELLGRFEASPVRLKGHPFLEEAWESKRAVFSSAPAGDSRIDAEIGQRFPVRSLLFVPLVVQGASIGGLFAFWWGRQRRFAPEELRLLEDVAGQAATVVTNARLYGAAQQHARELTTLREVGTTLASTLDLHSVLEAIAGSAVTLIGAQRSAVFELDPRDERLYARASRGMEPDQPFMPLRVGQGAAGLAALRREPVFSPDVDQQPLPMYDGVWEEAGLTLRTLVQQRGYRAILAVPLVSKERVFGAICIYWNETHRYDDREVRLLTALAQQAAIAIENARLYEESQARLARMRRLTRLSHLFTSSLDLQRVLDSVTEAALDLLGVETAQVWVVDRDARVLHIAAEASRGGLVGSVPMASELPLDQSVMGWVVEHKSKRYCPNVLDDPLFANKGWAGATGFVSLIAVPLVVGERALGGLCVLTRVPRALSQEDEELLELFATNAATAVENAQLYQDHARKNSHLQALFETAHRATVTLNLSDILPQLVESATKLIGGDASSIRLLDASGAALEAVAHHGLSQAFIGRGAVKVGEGVTGRIVLHGECVVVDDLEEDHQLVHRDETLAEGLRSLISIPLRSRDRIIGVLSVYSRTPRRYGQPDIDLLAQFGNLAAIAIENARSYQRAEQRAEKLRTLSTLMPLITSAPDSREVFRAVAMAATTLLGATLARVWVDDPAGRVLRVEGSHGIDPDRERMAANAPGMPYGRGMIGVVFTSRRPEYVSDIQADSRWVNVRFAEETGSHAFAGLPLVTSDHVVGVLSVLFGDSRTFSPEEKELMSLLADQAAITIERSRLFEDLKRSYEAVQHAQEQLTQAQKMEAVGKLAGGIAHDFNNLLTVILGRGNLLLHQLPPGDPPHRNVELIHKTAERAASLTRQLLAFSRKQLLQPKVLDANAVVGNLASILQRLIGEDIDLVMKLRPDLWRVNADPGQLEQVVMNLAVNARDAMPQGGKLTVKTANVELDEAFAHLNPGARPGSYVMLAVSDTGVGMDAQTQARVFEPFFTTKEPGKGTGLGLSTVYGIVKQHEGYVTVESAPGRGATFTIYLPRAEEDPGTLQGGEVHARPRSGTETVLLVEDELEVRELAGEILQTSGYTVLEASTPAEALDMCEREPGPIHLLLTDVVMPLMSGRALAERLTSLRSEMKVLYMSGYTDEALGHHGVLDEGTALLEKPFTPETLVRKTREVLDAPARRPSESLPAT